MSFRRDTLCNIVKFVISMIKLKQQIIVYKLVDTETKAYFEYVIICKDEFTAYKEKGYSQVNLNVFSTRVPNQDLFMFMMDYLYNSR